MKASTLLGIMMSQDIRGKIGRRLEGVGIQGYCASSLLKEIQEFKFFPT
jgi:hypothetical protein